MYSIFRHKLAPTYDAVVLYAEAVAEVSKLMYVYIVYNRRCALLY